MRTRIMGAAPGWTGFEMTGFILVLVIAVALIGTLVCVMGSSDRYGEMSEEEFEEEAKKKSLLGAAITGLEGTLRKREATVMMEAKSRVERDATPSPGDPPEEDGRKSRFLASLGMTNIGARP